MGLVELLQQGQTQLSVGAFPGDTPIYDPQSGFVQSNISANTYENETLGQPNNGSVLVNILDNTGLDNTIPLHDIDKPVPPLTANYPLLVRGEFDGAPSSPVSIYNPNNTYLSDVPIKDPNSPQLPTLFSSSLDNIDANAVQTATIPNSVSYPNNYPLLVKGEFKGAPSPYESIYNHGATYLSDVPIKDPNSPQIPTLGQTSLDNTNSDSESTTDPIPNANAFPNNWPTVSPQTGMGKFGFQPNQYVTIWASNNKYYSGFNYNVIITNSSNPLVNYMNLTGLTLDPNNFASFIQTYPFNQTYLGNPGFPSFVTGQFNGAPSIFPGTYDAGNTYLSNTPIQAPNSTQTTTLSKTGLDNTEASAAPSAIIPNSITYPNAYPLLTSGEFNGAPSQYVSPYNSSSTYLDAVPIQDPNSPQLPTLGETGLDSTDNNSSPTTIVPNNISYPNNYPAIEGVNLGTFSGAPTQYNTVYSPTNTYLNNIPIESETSRQVDTVLAGETALDNTVQQSFVTTSPPNNITSPTVYPSIPQTNLGEFNGAPSQYQTLYNPNSTYLDQYSVITNEANPQIEALQRTGMDVEDELYDEVAIFPPNPDTVTVYPAQNVTSNTINNVGNAPHPFSQIWKPKNRYYNDYIKLLKDQNLV
jgi:hypothetical protein